MKLAYALIGSNDIPVYVTGDGTHYDLTVLLPDIPLSPLGVALCGADYDDEITVAIAERGDLPNAVLDTNTVRWIAPLPRPARVLAIGRNYAEHAKEQGASVAEEPIVFLKSSQSVIAHREPIVIPSGVGRVDYEAELAVVIGQGGRNIAESDAYNHVAGYTILNDVTARDMQKKAQSSNLPWFLSKSLDTFCPMGPYLVTAGEIPDPHDLRIVLSVNGEIKQDDTTASMVFKIPTLIAYLSRYFALEPGDVIATGTPSGIDAIVPGDVVSVTITGLGTLTNPVVAG